MRRFGAIIDPMPAATLVWFRLDLRLADQPALAAACARGGPVVPVFIWSPEEEGEAAPGAASRWWLHQSLQSLDESLRRVGSRLTVRRGPALEALKALIKETGADAVLWNRRYEPTLIARDALVKERLKEDGVDAQSFNSALLFEPWEVKTLAGRPFQVFTPFWKACLARPEPAQPVPAPAKVAPAAAWPESIPLGELRLEPLIDWASGLREAWTPGEAGAKARLDAFAAEGAGAYATARDQMGASGVSRLSPHLHFGEISPRAVWEAVSRCAADARTPGPETYLKELGWREFAHHLLYHFPKTVAEPLRAEFAAFPWRRDGRGLATWSQGKTGYPVVDAGMRELWRAGWMHNRARMITASFLVKDLLVDWREGAAWFWDTLVDADLASNTLGWQWTAGCGADAAPFFRIFNPVLQGKKFDADGAYVRRWVPEIRALPPEFIHEPWNAEGETAGLYPARLVDHGAARDRALAALKTVAKNKPFDA
jgi:deoxyribodipyrimidine photo-lyase